MTQARFIDDTQWLYGDIIAPDDFHIVGQSPFEGVTGDLHRCACCNQKLTWRVVCQHPTTGERVILGRNCASKAAVKGLPKTDKEAQIIAARRIYNDPEFQRWAKTKPHSKGWGGRSLLDDLSYNLTRKPKLVFDAARQFKAEGPVLAVNRDAPVALTFGKGAGRFDVRLGWTKAHRKSGKSWAARIKGTSEQYGLDREFTVREFDEDGTARFLTSEPGVYEFASGNDRTFVRVLSDGTATIITKEEAA